MPTSKDASPIVAAELLTVARRPATYRVDADAAKAVTGEGSYVTRGVHVKTGAPALVHVDGSTQTALPLGVVGNAIMSGVITDAEIAQLQALR
jgi:outer membrane usher protein FimD/PapC